MIKQNQLSSRVSVIAGLIASIIAVPAIADELNMPRGVTEVSRQVYDLHMDIFWVCVWIGVLVFGVMIWSIIHHRKSAGHEAAQFHENTAMELGWTIVPTIILLAIAYPAVGVLIDMYDTEDAEMIVEVRGYQWKWQYKYLDEDKNSEFGFFSTLSTPRDEIENFDGKEKAAKGEFYLLEVDKPLVIPVNRKVRFLITSEDVIHAWWVPDFAIKRDAVPGMVNELWTIVEEPGVYRGQCTELCGKDHGFMPIVVNVLPEEEFDVWRAEEVVKEQARVTALSKTFTEEELMAEGKAIYATFCASCHMGNGQGIPPVFPSLVGTEVATGPRDEHIRRVYEGVTGTAMQAFGKQLDAAQLAAVVHYERNSWGNNAGDITQPRDVINLMTDQ